MVTVSSVVVSQWSGDAEIMVMTELSLVRLSDESELERFSH